MNLTALIAGSLLLVGLGAGAAAAEEKREAQAAPYCTDNQGNPYALGAQYCFNGDSYTCECPHSGPCTAAHWHPEGTRC